MKKILFILFAVSIVSCEKDEILPVNPTIQRQPIVTTPVTPIPSVQTHGLVIENYNPTKKITGLYIDGVLQKLDIGSYPVGYNQKVYAKSHTPICPYVYFTEGCKTITTLTYSDGGKFNEVRINRYKNGRVWQTLFADTEKGTSFIWNGTSNTSSTLGVNWNGQRQRPSNDIWNGPMEIIAK